MCLLMLVVEEGEDASSTTTLTNTTPNTYPYTGHTARLLVQVGE